jgi:quercetin dioxygenase-like cupin family protein
MPDLYPEMIECLPDADIPFKGVHGKLLQAGDYQVVFFDIEPIGEVAPHSHGAQFGFVLDGEMDLTIGGKTETRRKGDYYFIPAGVVHSATFRTRVRVMDMFAEPDRYKPKS